MWSHLFFDEFRNQSTHTCKIFNSSLYSLYAYKKSTKPMLLLFLDEGNAFMRHEFGENLLMH